MKTIQINSAVQTELEKQPKWRLMLFLQKHGEKSVYDISKELGWTTGKTHAIINSLINSKTVKSKKLIKNGRAVKLVKLVD